jgi:hypothetical protein
MEQGEIEGLKRLGVNADHQGVIMHRLGDLAQPNSTKGTGAKGRGATRRWG